MQDTSYIFLLREGMGQHQILRELDIDIRYYGSELRILIDSASLADIATFEAYGTGFNAPDEYYFYDPYLWQQYSGADAGLKMLIRGHPAEPTWPLTSRLKKNVPYDAAHPGALKVAAEEKLRLRHPISSNADLLKTADGLQVIDRTYGHLIVIRNVEDGGSPTAIRFESGDAPGPANAAADLEDGAQFNTAYETIRPHPIEALGTVSGADSLILIYVSKAQQDADPRIYTEGFYLAKKESEARSWHRVMKGRLPRNYQPDYRTPPLMTGEDLWMPVEWNGARIKPKPRIFAEFRWDGDDQTWTFHRLAKPKIDLAAYGPQPDWSSSGLISMGDGWFAMRGVPLIFNASDPKHPVMVRVPRAIFNPAYPSMRVLGAEATAEGWNLLFSVRGQVYYGQYKKDGLPQPNWPAKDITDALHDLGLGRTLTLRDGKIVGLTKGWTPTLYILEPAAAP